MTTPKNNPFLLQPEKAGADSNLASLHETGTDMTSPLVAFDSTHNSLEELASQDTTHINALRTRADNVMNTTERFVIPEAEGVRALCDTVDAAMQDDETLDMFELGKVRDYVKALMITLKAKPEFSGILLDSDVANIVRFARQMYTQAIYEQGALVEKKSMNAEKRKTRESKAAKDPVKRKKAAAFDALDLGKLGF